ncbi:amino acid ABC transporter permease [Pseudomonas sp. KNUC1026]|uniref:amino acid ABC transporter permease n=1 Tax=Pseudomonas sp. KNUC1026 TaxID=2893890 RepID=UPI001F3A6203|nr:amino acid ABC transporter permease [Pseudomonas sp. KNUC1026]UFH51704.1 amino acid ABC transporter permease [Pseudomonas sp. KNUC1026]
MSLDLAFMISTLPAFGRAVLVTLQVGALSIGGGLLVAFAANLLLAARRRWLTALVRGYVEVARNTPLLIQLFFIYFALPPLGVSVSGYASALIAMTFLGGAYLTEVLRAGIDAVPPAQVEAGRALGLSEGQLLGRIVLPQAALASLPALFANLIFLLKETTVVSAVAVPELLYTTKNYIALYYKTFEMLAVLTGLCLLLFLPLSLLLGALERRLQRGHLGV